jgi:nitrite reductase (NADH) large subunit
LSASEKKAWRCSVCGYVHYGHQPPDICPICGAPGESFETHAVETKPAAKQQVKSWRCVNCGYIHTGPAPPQTCPVCGVPQDSFEPVLDTVKKTKEAKKTVKVVVVGAGIAGLSAVEATRGASGQAQITLISKESILPYYRLNLTRYLAGQITEDELPIKAEKWFEDNKIQLLAGAEVSKLDLHAKNVKLHEGSDVSFDKLILTVGAHPFMPPFPGAYRQGVTNLRTVADAKLVIESAASGKNCVCIGGGLLGLETASALVQRGANVTLLEGHGWLLPRQLNQKAGQILAKHAEAGQIKLLTKARTKEILGDERVRGVLLEDDRVIEADLVVVATGIRSNSYLGRMSGLEVNRGVVVNNMLATSDPDVYAAGDVAEHFGCVYGTWGPAQYQGSIAGMNAVGNNTEFGGIPRSNTLKVLEVELFSIGQIEAEDASYDTVDQEKDDKFYRFVFRDSHLVGAILLGDTKLATGIKKSIEGKKDFSSILRKRPATEEIAHFIEDNIV